MRCIDVYTGTFPRQTLGNREFHSDPEILKMKFDLCYSRFAVEILLESREYPPDLIGLP